MPITVENAKELSAKGNAARWARFAADKANGIITARIAPVGVAEPLPINPFINQTLLDVRERMAELLKAMRGAPAGVDKFAAALGKLAEIERQLAGRPMPGSLKPPTPKADRRQTLTHATPEPEPEPISPPADLLSRPAE